MELIENLFMGYPNLWGGGVAHSVLILSLVITLGIALGKIKVAGVSLGVTWILFVGIVFGHFNMNLNEHLLHFLKEVGLILFVYSIGLQVGPGFFSAFKKGGFTLNVVAMIVVFTGVVMAIVLHFVTGTPITTMVGILSGAVTNTPGLGAAQQANSDLNGVDAPEIALGLSAPKVEVLTGCRVNTFQPLGLMISKTHKLDDVRQSFSLLLFSGTFHLVRANYSIRVPQAIRRKAIVLHLQFIFQVFEHGVGYRFSLIVINDTQSLNVIVMVGAVLFESVSDVLCIFNRKAFEYQFIFAGH